MKLCISSGIADRYGDRIAEAAPDAELILLQPDGTLGGGAVDEIEAFFNSGDLLTREGDLGSVIIEISRSPALQWFQSGAAGFENPMLEAVRDREGVRLTNAAGVHAEPIAQYVLAYMLQRVKRVQVHAESQRNHQWQPIGGGELTNLTCGIVGLGGIGAAVARLAKAFGMQVLATKRTPVEDPNVDRLLSPDDLHTLLQNSDFVVLALPMSEETRGLIGAAELAQMRERAVLINVARGGVLDEPALIEALNERRIGGAVLDVASQEPLPEDSPLWDLPNCVVTPHDSAWSPLGGARQAELFLDNLARFVAGDALVNEV
ncbi:MAG TPA: D-2-hydroxyacid dehydrogenase [Dehalococcoidia bacterium]|jgi:phosphoglycerate dehydrogenase-like enzyme|nr:D-2-hydroxyacid dehydrogenase [Dehalococcoidia bacterium]